MPVNRTCVIRVGRPENHTGRLVVYIESPCRKGVQKRHAEKVSGTDKTIKIYGS